MRWLVLDACNKQALAIAALALAVFAIAPRPAHASREGAHLLPDFGAPIGLTLGIATFLTVDIAYLARAEPLPTGWAVLQLFVAAPITLAFATFEHDKEWRSLRTTCAIAGSWFAMHGALNLVIVADEDSALVQGRASF